MNKRKGKAMPPPMPQQGMQNMTANPAQLENIRKQLIAKQFDAAFEKKLNEYEFPAEDMKPEWIAAATAAMTSASPIGLGISFAMMIDILDALDPSTSTKLNLYQTAVVSNHLESRSMNDLHMVKDEYFATMKVANELQAKWNQLTGDIRAQTIAEIEANLNLQQAPVVAADAAPIGEISEGSAEAQKSESEAVPEHGGLASV